MQSMFMKRATWGELGAAAMLLAGSAHAAGVPGQGTWETTLLGRDINGHPVDAASDSAVFLYDTTLDITWLRDANYAATGGYDSEGRMTWHNANTWANSLTVGAFSGWRLPTLKPVNGSAFQYVWSNNGSTDGGYAKTGTGWGVASEMGHLFYVTLGNKGYCKPNDASPRSCAVQPGYGPTNTGSFQNMQSDYYWYGLEFAPGPGNAWVFRTDYGGQDGSGYKDFGFYALAVRPGDVATPCDLPTLSALISSKTGTQDARTWAVTVSNKSYCPGQSAQIDGLKLTQTYGVACTPVITSPTAFPLALGDIAANGKASGPVTVNFSACSSTARFTAKITYSANDGAVKGSKTLNNQFR